MERLLLVRCPALQTEDESGDVLCTFARVVAAVGAYCPWVTAVRPGVCMLPARGPARFFGGEQAVVDLVAEAARTVPGVGPVEVGIAEGLFAAYLAARAGVPVAPGETAAFLAPYPLATLGRPELEDLLCRLGVATLGAFARLPERDVLARFGRDGMACHRVARGLDGELPGLREASTQKRLDRLGADTAPPGRQGGFWGGHRDADVRATRALVAVQRLLGTDSVQVARRQGGRAPTDQVRFVTWSAAEPATTPDRAAPWPGQIPSPAPATVYERPVQVEVTGEGAEPVTVTGRGALNVAPQRLSIDGGAWAPVAAWAGPWPAWEQWWKPGRRRVARLQVVTTTELAHLLTAQKGSWWLTATYD